MTLLLLQQGYPLVIIHVKDRTAYISAIQQALQGKSEEYYRLMYAAIEQSLDEYLQAAAESKIQ